MLQSLYVVYDFITKSLLLPEIESRRIYSLSSKICLNILICSKISIIRTVQFNVTVCFHSTGWFLPPPFIKIYSNLPEPPVKLPHRVIPCVRTDVPITS